uniref:Uncharacterized protein n=1 Tax=Heterosigma akashiwo TaxID=2829 RepID=A0A6S9L345_HETAK|mmetsp:Transcript_37940/g.66336  ORF Transcript_37940/g.66336 Transcript_37940/m.66336 type:complete len:241 (+) Transcript_37940:67-789(+)
MRLVICLVCIMMLVPETLGFQAHSGLVSRLGAGIAHKQGLSMMADGPKGFGKVENQTPKKKSPKSNSAAAEIKQLEDAEMNQVEELPDFRRRPDASSETKSEEEIDAQLRKMLKTNKPPNPSPAPKSARVDAFGNPLKERYYIIDFIPIPVQNVIENGLIVGLSALLLFFLLGGIGIGASGVAVITNNPLPEGLERFIADTLEPSFTPTLLVFFVLSSTLGVFKSLQFESRSDVQYREED